MRISRPSVLASVVCSMILSNPVFAHHGVTHYDMKKTILLTGTITGFEWANPHCLAYLDVTDDKGVMQHWTLELSSTLVMAKQGWNKDSLKRGDQVVAETHPASNGAPVGITSGPGFSLKVIVNGKDMPSR